MKRLKFGTKSLDIKEESLHRLIDSAVGCKDITRASLSRASGVGLTTAGKLLSAMDSCGFTRRVFDRTGERNGHEKLHLLSDDLSILALDFSSRKYSAALIFDRGEQVIREEYRYDPNITFENNLMLFLSIIGKKLSALPYSASAICTVTADDSDSLTQSSAASFVYLPQSGDLRIIDELCAKFFKQCPIVHLTLSEAVRCSVKYGIVQRERLGNVSYILFKDSFSAFYLPKKQPSIRFRAEGLIWDTESSFLEMVENAQTSREAAKIIMRLANLMDCAYPTDAFLVEYDRNLFEDELAHYVDLAFKASEISPHSIIYWDHHASIPELGAAASALSELIKSQIRSVK
jgi:hypothetical protein